MSVMGYGGLYISNGGTGTQALTTTVGAVTGWTAASVNSNTRDGDQSVRPDLTNSRILVSKGVYRVHVDLTVLGGGTVTVIASVRKNGVVQAHLGSRGTTTTSASGKIAFEGYLEVLASDSPGTIAQFADPASTGFAGAGGAPKLDVPLDLVLSLVSSTDTTTLVDGHFNVSRVA